MRFPFKLDLDKEFDVVGFGTNAVDHLIVVPEYPKFDSKVELIRHVRAAGGEVATAMVGLSRLGLKTSYAGRFGKDSEGNFGLQSLLYEGVDTRFAEQIEGASTQIAFIVIDKRSGERTVIWHRDDRLAYTENEAPSAAAALGKVFHFTPHDTRACVQMAREAKASGSVVSIDIDNVFEGVAELLKFVDILISSAEFPEKLTGITDPKTGLREIRSNFGCAVAGLTLGEKGSLILCENEFIETPSFAVPNGAKDTTGAGDSFRAGFLFGLLTKESVEDSARIANAVAALKCRELGARTALPNREELAQFIASPK